MSLQSGSPPSEHPLLQRLAVLAAMVLALLPTLWPGDHIWFWDEPMEIAIALQANWDRRLATSGLSGSFPVPYGALGIHLYQAWLVLTRSPAVLVVLHALACAIPTAVALLWLARTLRLNPWFAVLILAGPHMWFEARRLWQPSFCVPLSAMAVAALAAHLRHGSGRALVATVACAIGPLLVHLQSIPLAVTILGYLALRQRPALRRHWRGLSAVLAVLLLFHGPYLLVATHGIAVNLFSFVREGHNSHTAASHAWLGPLLAGRIWSGWDWNGLIWDWGWSDATVVTLTVLASVTMPLVWLGMALALRQLWRKAPAAPGVVPQASRLHDSLEQETRALRGRLLLICGAGVLIHFALCVTFRLSTVHHYFFGVFGLYVLLAWIGLASLPFRWLRVGLLVVGTTASLALTTRLITQVHRYGWPRPLGPTLAEQCALARALDDYADQLAFTEIDIHHARPWVLWDLRRLLGTRPDKDRVLSGQLLIRYRLDEDGRESNRIELVQSPPSVGARLMALAPIAQSGIEADSAARTLLARLGHLKPGDPPTQACESPAIAAAFPTWTFRVFRPRPSAPQRQPLVVRITKDGSAALVTDEPGTLHGGLVRVVSAAGARLAAAAVLSVLPGPQGPSLVMPEEVRVTEATGGGWVCSVERHGVRHTVRFDDRGRCADISVDPPVRTTE